MREKEKEGRVGEVVGVEQGEEKSEWGENLAAAKREERIECTTERV